MAEQNFKNHARIDPLMHYVIFPALLVNLAIAAVRLVHHANGWRGWNVALALVLLLLAARVRTSALTVQDRVIRLEERIRMAALMPLESRSLQRELTAKQIVALRFASDEELAALAQRAVQEKLSPKAIKQQIAHWRADYYRV